MSNHTTHMSLRCNGNRCVCISDVGLAPATVTGDVAPRARVLGEALRAAMVTPDDDLWSCDLIDRGICGPELDDEEAAAVVARLRALGVGVA